MWKYMCMMLCLSACCSAGPAAYQKRNMPIMAREDTPLVAEQEEMPEEPEAVAAADVAPMVGTLTLPSNATSIRADITDNFSCANKSYGYYADVENDCQIFHVCLPVTYADGKENTFRWSFICPEETVFSQESFTCMRREDMTIECEDSSRYYDLNGNFGLPTEEENIKQPASSMVDNEEPQMQNSKPMQSHRPMESTMPIAAEPTMDQAKPVKAQKPKPKPNRRKPALSYNKPQPQRKAPPATAMPSEPVEEPIAIIANPTPLELESKPQKPQRFSEQPHKEKPQVIKVAVTPTRTELFNSNRKRPAIFNKNSAPIAPKPVEESETVTEAIVQAELGEPQPTLKLQTMFIQPVVEATEADVAAQASEAAEVITSPEQTEEALKVDEARPTKDEITTDVEQVAPVEAIEEIPAVIVETLEEKPKETEKVVESESSNSEQQPEKELITVAKAPAEPSIIEPSSSGEDASNNIEAMEAAKPADAPESMQATPEMEHHSPLVEEVLESSSSHEVQKESIGGFKPVDPVMAAEAEQLITDFLNTLRKNEEKTETELVNNGMHMAETINGETEKEEELPVNALKHSSELQTADEAISIEEAKLPEPEIIEKEASVEEQLLESEQPKQEQQLKKDSPITNILMLNSLPSDSYQIPVQVIDTTKVEEAPEDKQPETEESIATAAYMPPISIDDIVELVKERLDQAPKGEQMSPMELVLTPGAAAPMTLIQSTNEPAQEQPIEPDQKPEANAELPATQEAEQQPEEEVILPIYKRVFSAEPSMAVVQTAPVTATKVETVEQAVQTEPEEVRQPKSARAHQTSTAGSKMDARKRRFLFRADAS
ncbi:titin [Scaptodrosophila lebanonensis]|uniref:Titin n=1 Tax=Drosophila lebanonensis TaxID=7225 RepID=A0A6J2TZU2_DROLE|nr:titin [Scaptodrosophila lebanonensis]